MAMYLNKMERVTLVVQAVSALTIFSCIAWVVYTRFFHPLRHIPGPFWASVTRYWWVIQTMSGKINYIQRDLHQRYGPLVRIAPDEVSCGDAQAIKTIYPIQSPWTKTDFYDVWSPRDFSKYLDSFTVRDEKVHAQRLRIVSQLYSMTNVLRSEHCVDKVSTLFLTRLGELADTGRSIDLGQWIQWFTWDVIGELFFGNMFGFLERKCDHQNFIYSIDTFMPVLAIVGTAPAYIRPFMLLSSMFSSQIRNAVKAFEHIVHVAKKAPADRAAQGRKLESRQDILQQLLDIVEEKGARLDFGIGEVQMETYVALGAGSDSNAVALGAIFYFIITTPSVYQQLQNEIDEAARLGRLSEPVKYSEASCLPFLSACVKEAMRLHPSFAFTLPRHVPRGGAEVANTYLPEGTRVGMNPAVVHFDTNVFGKDAEQFRPARWLEDGAVIMEKHILTFGAGTRVCSGKHISLCEIYKIVPDILRHYKLELAPDANWQTEIFWFWRQSGLKVNISRRDLTA